MSPKVWFITGASSGMGRSMTEYVLDRGDIAIATLRKPEVLSDLTTNYDKDKLLILKLDVKSLQEILDAFAKAKEAFGRIDVVFNNAGYGWLGEIEGTPLDLARDCFEVNFWGASNVLREAVRFFREENKPCGGFIINNSSMDALEAEAALGYYSSSKFALNGLIEGLVKELSPSWNIKVTILELGYVATRGSEVPNIIPTIHPAYNDPSLPSYKARAFAGNNPSFPVSSKEMTIRIYKLVDLETPPLHFPLGKDALQACIGKSKAYAEAAEKYASWSEGLAS